MTDEPYRALNDLLPTFALRECSVCFITVLCMWDEEPPYFCYDHEPEEDE